MHLHKRSGSWIKASSETTGTAPGKVRNVAREVKAVGSVPGGGKLTFGHSRRAGAGQSVSGLESRVMGQQLLRIPRTWALFVEVELG